ncbi:hypothetical protein ACERK3_15645 [Phycisphaerales bacterium AB-hyl4]|uniref:Uncharacterized protein n=1 Tax=Natronomicrosphaera hydrolytica TaxID=3242702 RepID=A0ABV4U7Z3_9BACT
MSIAKVSSADDSLVIHFDTENRRINAYTLASVLVSIADAAKAANLDLNPGYDVEVVVEAIGPGSFRAKISTLHSKVGNLFSRQNFKAIVLGVISSFIYQQVFSVNDGVKVTVNTDEVVIEQGDDRVIVPRVVYESTQQAERNPQFRGAVARTFETLRADEGIRGIGFVADIDSPPPSVLLRREAIEKISLDGDIVPDTRPITERCMLQIVKAILDRGRRKWEFMWRGVKISAPISDPEFYDRFFAHKITIAPGDFLDVNLKIVQAKDPETGIYSNVGYEVVEVFQHEPRIRQIPLTDPGEE